MPITRGEIKGKVLRLLMKTPAYPGPYTDDTINDALTEAMDFVATEMFEANEGWLTKMRTYDTLPNQVTFPIPEGVAMIQMVRYLVGNVYMPLQYDDQSQQPQYADAGGAVQFPYSYKIVDNAIYFNPPLADGGPDFLQLEQMEYAKELQDDTDFMDGQFDKSMQHFIKYRTASILGAGLEKYSMPWAGLEADWYKKMTEVIIKRNRQATPIRMFGDS